jgi:hypothetical protein
VRNIIDRKDLGGNWALVTTENGEEGWSLLDALSKIERWDGTREGD